MIDGLQVRSEGTEEDNFFYIQSVWESAPLSVSNKEDFSKPMLMAFVVPEQPGNGASKVEPIFVHLIPAGVLHAHPQLFTPDEIKGKRNCVEIDRKFANSPALQAFRSEWVEFWNSVPNPSKQQVVDKSQELGKLLNALKTT